MSPSIKFLYNISFFILLSYLLASPSVPSNGLRKLLNELQNRILRIFLVWSLFYFNQVHVGLHFLPILLETTFLSFCALCVFRFESTFWIRFLTCVLLNPHSGYDKIGRLSPAILVSNGFWRQIFAHVFLSYLYCCSKALFYEVQELWLLKVYKSYEIKLSLWNVCLQTYRNNRIL